MTFPPTAGADIWLSGQCALFRPSIEWMGGNNITITA